MDYYVKYVEVNMFFINLLKSISGGLAIVLSYVLLRFVSFKYAAFVVLLFLLLCSAPLLLEANSANNTLLIMAMVGITSGISSLFTLIYFFVSDSFPPAIVPIVLTLSHF